MTLGNMRELGVQRLIAYCLNDACRHSALIDVPSCPGETEGAVVPFAGEVREVRHQECGCTAELEGAATAGEPDREAVPLKSHPVLTKANAVGSMLGIGWLASPSVQSPASRAAPVVRWSCPLLLKLQRPDTGCT
jgi:hypothetical protein